MYCKKVPQLVFDLINSRTNEIHFIISIYHWRKPLSPIKFHCILTCTWYCEVSCIMILELEYFFLCSEKKKDNKLSVQRLFIRILGRIIVLMVGCYSLSFQFQSVLRIKDINFCLEDWQIRCIGCTFKLYPVTSLLIWFQHWLWRKWNLVYGEASDNKWQGHSWKRAGKKRNSLSRPAQGCDVHVARNKIQPQSSSLDTTAHLHVL